MVLCSSPCCCVSLRCAFLVTCATVVVAIAPALLHAASDPVPLTRPSKVAITPDGRLTVDGNPFFLIGTAPAPPVDLRTPEGGDGWAELAEGGLNVVRIGGGREGWSTTATAAFGHYADVLAAHGIHAWPNVGSLMEDPGNLVRLTAIVNKYKAHPALLMWKSADEPEWTKRPVATLVEAYRLTRQLDPDHPVWINHAPRGTTDTLMPYSAACDAVSFDVYPIGVPPGKHSLEANKGLSMVGDYTRRAVYLAQGRRMPFMVLQVCWSGVLPSNNPRNRLMFPTAREERYMLYQAFINGANGLSLFGFSFGNQGRDAELGFNWSYWRAVIRPLLVEMKPGGELNPVLTAPDTSYPLTFTGAPRIEVRTKEVGPYLYIFAAAREGNPVSVEFAGVENAEVTVLQEGRTIMPSGNAFQDTFASHDVHIYRAHRRYTMNLPVSVPKSVHDGGRGAQSGPGYWVPPGAKP